SRRTCLAKPESGRHFGEALARHQVVPSILTAARKFRRWEPQQAPRIPMLATTAVKQLAALTIPERNQTMSEALKHPDCWRPTGKNRFQRHSSHPILARSATEL